MNPVIALENIEKSYGPLHVLRGVSLSINPAEVVSIVGASGAGKTTLLQILGTLTKPNSGSYMFENTDILKLNDQKLSAFRNQKMGFVFQFHQLLPEFTAIENVCIPALINKQNKKDAQNRATEILGMLGLSGRLQHKPSELSGGEQQRVAVARALMNNPPVVLADEPSGNLDSANAQMLHQLFFDLRDELKVSFVIVTHNQELAQLSDRTITMKDGLIAE